MTQLTISIPPHLQSAIDERLAQGAYVDAGDYVRDLVRQDLRAEAARAHIRELIAEGEASGIVDAEPEDVLEEIMAAIPARYD